MAKAAAVDGVDAGVLDAAGLHLRDPFGVDVGAVPVARPGRNQRRPGVDRPPRDAVVAARQTEHADSASQVGAEQQHRLSAHDRGSGVVHRHDLQVWRLPRVVDLMRREDRVAAVAQHRLAQRHGPASALAQVDLSFHVDASPAWLSAVRS